MIQIKKRNHINDLLIFKLLLDFTVSLEIIKKPTKHFR